MTQSHFSHLWPRVISFPFNALISRRKVIFSHLWLRVISFPFSALSSRPIVLFSFMTQSNLFHWEHWAQDLESFFSFMTHNHFFSIESPQLMTRSCFSDLLPKVISFPFKASSSRPGVVFLIYDPKSFLFPFRALNLVPRVVFSHLWHKVIFFPI